MHIDPNLALSAAVVGGSQHTQARGRRARHLGSRGGH